MRLQNMAMGKLLPPFCGVRYLIHLTKLCCRRFFHFECFVVAYSSFNISHDGFPLSFSHTKSRRKSVSKNTTLCHANYLRSLATRLSPILCWLSFRAAPTAPYRNHFFNYAFLCDMLVFRHRLFFFSQPHLKPPRVTITLKSESSHGGSCAME